MPTLTDLREQLDRARDEGWLVALERAEDARELPRGLLLAIASRETSVHDIVGDGGHGRGLMQIDDRSHQAFLRQNGVLYPGGLPPVQAAVHYAAAMLRGNLEALERYKVPEEHRLRIAVAAYNAGLVGAMNGWKEGRDPDLHTTGHDYSTDVLERHRLIKRLYPPKGPVELPLVLTSPLMRGPVVLAAQKALRDNEYGTFYRGEVDGEYGEWTAQATHRAKHWCGFLSATPVYGSDIDDVLTGAKGLSPPRKLRRTGRLREAKKAAEKGALGKRIIAEARKDIRRGTTEDPPGSNKNWITKLYGLVGPWCAMGGSVWMKKAGSKIPIIGLGYRGRYHYCPTALADAQAGRNNLTLTREPVEGDIVLYDWDDDRVPDHWGHFIAWTDRAAGNFTAAEGNTTIEGRPGSQSDGGAAAERHRNTRDVARTARGDLAFIHPGA